MKREQAAEIIRHLLDADSAMERASRAIAGLGKEERLRLDDLLEDVIIALQSEVLAPIFDQHPELKPQWEKEEEPFINSEVAGIRLAFRQRHPRRKSTPLSSR